jgi:hypothetical protein
VVTAVDIVFFDLCKFALQTRIKPKPGEHLEVAGQRSLAEVQAAPHTVRIVPLPLNRPSSANFHGVQDHGSGAYPTRHTCRSAPLAQRMSPFLVRIQDSTEPISRSPRTAVPRQAPAASRRQPLPHAVTAMAVWRWRRSRTSGRRNTRQRRIKRADRTGWRRSEAGWGAVLIR